MSTSVPLQLSERLCHKCAVTDKLRIPLPCPSHPNNEEGSNQILPNTFLYDSTLSDGVIRTLRLLPGSGNDPISCHLEEGRLDKVSYTALSYRWGSDATPQTIICNGQNLNITQSLFEALWQFREDGKMGPMWIDAICINQAHTTEKTSQVRMMRDIYRQSSLTIAWLGKEEETDGVGFEMFMKLFKQYGANVEDLLKAPNLANGDELGLPPFDDPVWAAFCRILYRPYFFRIWIVQEILTPEKCIVQCGTHSLDRDVVFAVVTAVEQYRYLKNMVASNGPMHSKSNDMVRYHSVRDLCFIQMMLEIRGGQTIHNLLCHTKMFEAKDPRDKIFALVGLCSDVGSTFIDYEKTLEQIQIEIAKLTMDNEEVFGPMTCSFVDIEHHYGKIPSWATDWTSGGPRPSSLGGSWYARLTFETYPQNWSFTEDNKMVILGKTFDSLKSIVQGQPYMIPASHDVDFQIQNTRDMEAWHDQCWALVTTLDVDQYIGTGEHPYQAYWRTLIFNTERFGVLATSEMEQSYAAWKRWESLRTISSEIHALLDASKQEAVTAPTPRTGILGRGNSLGKILQKAETMREQAEAAEPFNEAFMRYSAFRRFCTTGWGFMGWVPDAAKEGDKLCYFLECPLPFVIRELGNGEYRLIGECYFHGIMNEQPPAVELIPNRALRIV